MEDGNTTGRRLAFYGPSTRKAGRQPSRFAASLPLEDAESILLGVGTWAPFINPSGLLESVSRFFNEDCSPSVVQGLDDRLGKLIRLSQCRISDAVEIKRLLDDIDEPRTNFCVVPGRENARPKPSDSGVSILRLTSGADSITPQIQDVSEVCNDDEGPFNLTDKFLYDAQPDVGSAQNRVDGEYLCATCKKRFGTVQQLKQHQKSHQKPFVCDKCGHCFAWEKDLRRHDATHRARHEKDDFACPLETCTATFSRNDNLSRHLRSMHQPALRESDVPILTTKRTPANSPLAPDTALQGSKGQNIQHHANRTGAPSGSRDASTATNSVQASGHSLQPSQSGGHAPKTWRKRSRDGGQGDDNGRAPLPQKKGKAVSSPTRPRLRCFLCSTPRGFVAVSHLRTHLRHKHGVRCLDSCSPPERDDNYYEDTRVRSWRRECRNHSHPETVCLHNPFYEGTENPVPAANPVRRRRNTEENFRRLVEAQVRELLAEMNQPPSLSQADNPVEMPPLQSDTFAVPMPDEILHTAVRPLWAHVTYVREALPTFLGTDARVNSVLATLSDFQGRLWELVSSSGIISEQINQATFHSPPEVTVNPECPPQSSQEQMHTFPWVVDIPNDALVDGLAPERMEQNMPIASSSGGVSQTNNNTQDAVLPESLPHPPSLTDGVTLTGSMGEWDDLFLNNLPGFVEEGKQWKSDRNEEFEAEFGTTS